MRLATRLSQALLYSCGAFYTNPWKVPVQFLVGDTYAVGYSHFRRDHHTSANLRLHLACCVLQLLGNFGLLHALDAMLGYQGTVRPVSFASAVPWVLCQLLCPAPPGCRALAAAAIAAAYAVAPCLAPGHSIELLAFGSMTLAMLPARAPKADPSRAGLSPARWLPTLLFLFGHWLALERGLACVAGGALAHRRVEVNVGLLALVGTISLLPNPVTASTIVGAYAGRAAHVLTRQPHLYFFSLAFLAVACQGVSHALTGERVRGSPRTFCRRIPSLSVVGLSAACCQIVLQDLRGAQMKTVQRRGAFSASVKSSPTHPHLVPLRPPHAHSHSIPGAQF
jgi:hypothetical protein